MKATELRIGNYVNYEQTTHVVCGVDDYRVLNYWAKDVEREELQETLIGFIKPIPLTEEWLLKFGFEKSVRNEYIAPSDNIPFNYNTYFNSVFIEVDGLDLELEHIKYVHQIQNLYFALTGKELTYE